MYVRVFVEVRVYDPGSSVRRPVLSVSYDDCPTTTLCIQPTASQYVHCRFILNVIGPIPWGHSGPLCHALSSLSSTSMHTRRATVLLATSSGEWA